MADQTCPAQETGDLQSTLDAIDDVAVHECGWCQRHIDENGPSPDFCSAICQTLWIQRKHEVDELVGYREPTDVAAHVGNQVEFASPETTPVDRRQFVGGHHLVLGFDGARSGGVVVGQVVGADPGGDPVVQIRVQPDMTQLRESVARFMELMSRVRIDLTEWQRSMLEAAFSTRDLRRALLNQPMRSGRSWSASLSLLQREMDEEPTAEPDPRRQAMQRALELRRNRNTGPTQPARALRRLDARGDR